MKRRIIYMLALLVIFIFSCKKNSNEQSSQPIPSAPDYIQLSVGNYWVYEFYKVDTNGVEQKLIHKDSSYIQKDTMINGIKYFIKISNPLQFTRCGSPMLVQSEELLRDSSGYLLMRYSTGEIRILFARDNFTDILYSDTVETLAFREVKMTGKDSLVSMPAGNFTTRSACQYLYPLHPDYPWGLRKDYYVYGRWVGEIKYTYCLYSQPGHYEARLVRYHVSPNSK